VSKAWKYRKVTVAGQPVTEDCVTFLRLTFYKANHIYTANTTQFVPDCNAFNGNWNLSEDENSLRVYPSVGEPSSWQLIELSDTLLHYLAPATVGGQASTSEAWMVPAP
jgi:hypothetical protein